MSTIGNNIKKYREAKGLTQKQVAEAVGKTKNVVSNWEQGSNKPDTDTVSILCGLFDIDANTLMGWDNTEQLKADAKNVADQILRNPKIKEMLPEIAGMSSEDIDLLKSFIQRMKSK